MRALAANIAWLALLGGCAPSGGASIEVPDGTDPVPTMAVGEVVPDFTLVDRNPSSPGDGDAVSPRDYLEKVSGWYFTHAT